MNGDANEIGHINETDADCGELEMLDFMLRVIFNGDRSELARRLIDRFGSFHGIFKATHAELVATDGMTDRAATFFEFARPVFRQAALRSLTAPIDCEYALAAFGFALFLNADYAEYCVFLDGDGAVAHVERLTEPNRVREIVGKACRFGAQRVVWLCNFPRGRALRPYGGRRKDVDAVIRSLRLLDIEFVDYFVCTTARFYSLRRETLGGSGISLVAFASEERYSKSPCTLGSHYLRLRL